VPPSCPPEYSLLLRDCWQHDPDLRPTFLAAKRETEELHARLLTQELISPAFLEVIRMSKKVCFSARLSEQALMLAASLQLDPNTFLSRVVMSGCARRLGPVPLALLLLLVHDAAADVCVARFLPSSFGPVTPTD
jgi:hypothetical protein